jgi:hypothetical protein
LKGVVFRSIDNPTGRRFRAVTLIEAVLYISIALALIVGGLVFFQQASTAQKTNTMVRQLSALIAETRVLVKGQPLNTVTNSSVNSTSNLNITAFLISAGAVPSDMIASPTTLSNPFGGITTVNAVNLVGFGPIVWITSTNVPQGVCARLLTGTSGASTQGGSTTVASGYLFGGAMAPTAGIAFQNFIMNPTEAGWMCKYGALSYTVQHVQPSTAPISGDVNLYMSFAVER